MPAGHDVYEGHSLMPTYQQSTNDSYNGDESAASILKSVKAQEAQFERLTRELEVERESVANQLEKCKLGSETASMASISSTDESFHWRGPPPQQQSYLEDESTADSKMSSHLLDSCLRELEDRGAMNFGEDGNMDYLHEDPYSTHRLPAHSDPYSANSVGYGSGNYNNPNMTYDRNHSPHGSHASLQSTGSNRPGTRVTTITKVQGPRGSLSSLPQEQQNGNYATYSSMSRPMDDLRGSPLPRSASPRGPDPSRFTLNHLPHNYHNLQSHYGSSPRGSLARYSDDSHADGYLTQVPLDHYDSFGPRDDSYPGSRNSYQAPSDHGAPPYKGQEPRYEDRYPDSQYSRDLYKDHPLDDSHYRDSPVGDPYNGPRHPDDADRYGDHPLSDRQYGEPNFVDRNRDQSYEDDGYRGPPYYDDHLQESPNVDRRHIPVEGQRDQVNDRDPRDNRYGDYPDDSFRGRPEQDDPGYRHSYQDHPYDAYNSHPDDRYGAPPSAGNDPDDSRYRGSYQGHPDEPDQDSVPYQGGYQGHPDDSYRDQGDDPYGDRPVSNPDPNDPRFRNSYQGHPDDPYADHPGDQPELLHRMNSLPPLRKHPFADDPFQQGGDSYPAHRDEDPYHRGPSPSQGPGPYDDRAPHYGDHSYDDQDGPQPYDSSAPSHYDYNGPPEYPNEGRPYYEDDVPRADAPHLGAPVGDFHSDGRRTPSDGRPGSSRWRNPDLQEVIDYLNHQDNDIKAHAAAYLQHLCFMDDGMKAKTRGLDGIRPLIRLLSNEFPEVHKNACGALQNLSYGKSNDENKKAIKNEGGIPELIRLLRKTQDEDVKENVTGVLWNLSSCEDLKKPIIDDGLAVLVNVVVVPHSGWDRLGASPYRDHDPWTTVFRNATGVLRNVSSAGAEARKKLRECRGLVNALIHTLKSSPEGDMDSKPVENVVCVLRNLSYRIQEVEDPDFYKKRGTLPRQQKTPEKGENTGCFGGGNSGKQKKGSQPKGNDKNNPNQKPQPQLPAGASEYKGLWGTEVVQLYSVLLKLGSNPVTLEATAGAIQNLTACDWQPAVEIRAMVRKEKGLPHLVDLLTFESDRVVCAAATALRNLAIDERNKELVGKYAMQQLVRKLPQNKSSPGPAVPDDTLCAVIATLYEVVKNNQDFAQSLLLENGIPRLMNITKSEGQYLARTIKYAASVLRTMWQFRALHTEYAKMGKTERDFLTSTSATRPEGSRFDGRSPSSNHTTPYNTLSRPMSAQGYDDNTLSSTRPIQKRPNNYEYNSRMGNNMDGYLSMNQSNSALNDPDRHNIYAQDRSRPEEIQMTDMGPGYAPIDEPRRTKPPVGGVPLFPNLPANESQGDPQSHPPEPLYAQVNKGSRRRNDDYVHSSKLMLDSSSPQAGADSWV